jgi:hypothetical protein|tara:strand:+ start:567 stop:689 length:123 start_codon:yes stop_codon:yes gene_type:complete
MEGTAKLGADLKSRRKTMAAARAAAEANVASTKAAPAAKK